MGISRNPYSRVFVYKLAQKRYTFWEMRQSVLPLASIWPLSSRTSDNTTIYLVTSQATNRITSEGRGNEKSVWIDGEPFERLLWFWQLCLILNWLKRVGRRKHLNRGGVVRASCTTPSYIGKWAKVKARIERRYKTEVQTNFAKRVTRNEKI